MGHATWLQKVRGKNALTVCTFGLQECSKRLPCLCGFGQDHFSFSLTILPFSHGSLILCCGEAAHVVFNAFSKGNDKYVATDFVCPWKII